MCALVTGVQTCAVPISKGGSAWPQSACSGIIESGQIRITPKGRSFQVVVTGAIVHSGNRHPAWCTQDSIDISFTASERPFASLTPWLGTAGDHPYEESYPRDRRSTRLNSST